MTRIKNESGAIQLDGASETLVASTERSVRLTRAQSNVLAGIHSGFPGASNYWPSVVGQLRKLGLVADDGRSVLSLTGRGAKLAAVAEVVWESDPNR